MERCTTLSTLANMHQRVSRLLELAEAELDAAVLDALLAGASWREIGKATGVDPSTAFRRWRRLVELQPRYRAGGQ